jgi:ABC-2 type transport system permease protein
VLFHVAETTTSPREYADDVTATLVASAVLPLVVLLLGVAAFGNEVGDRTLVYLTTKPLPRWRIVAPKLLAVVRRRRYSP